MTQQRWKQVREIFDSALDKPTAARDAYIDETCGSDDALRNEVLSLIKSLEGHADFLEKPVDPLAFSEKPVDRMEGRTDGRLCDPPPGAGPNGTKLARDWPAHKS